MNKICPPFRNCYPVKMTQGFSPTHKANDFFSFYGDWLLAPCDCKVERIITAETLDNKTDDMKRGFGISMIDSEGNKYLYWHCLSQFPVEVGEELVKGQICGQEGNSGFVLANGKYVPIEIRNTPNYQGTHVHEEIMLKDGTMIDPSSIFDWTYKTDYGLNFIGQQIVAITRIFKRIGNILKGR